MEIIIGLLVVGAAAWFFFMRNGKKTDEIAPSKDTAPYKVPEPAATTKIPLVVDVLPAGTEASSILPTATKAKVPAKPKATAKPKASAKTPPAKTPPAKALAKAPVKTAAKTTKAPTKPKVTVAK